MLTPQKKELILESAEDTIQSNGSVNVKDLAYIYNASSEDIKDALILKGYREASNGDFIKVDTVERFG